MDGATQNCHVGVVVLREPTPYPSKEENWLEEFP